MASGRERRTPAPRWHTDLFDVARQARAGNVQVMLSRLSVAEAALSVPDDDHPVVRTGGRRLLEQAGDIDVVAEAGAAFEAIGA